MFWNKNKNENQTEKNKTILFWVPQPNVLQKMVIEIGFPSILGYCNSALNPNCPWKTTWISS